MRESAIQNERELGAIAMEMPMRDAFGSSLIKLLDSVFSGLSGCERSGGSVASIINLATHDYIMLRGTTIHNAGHVRCRWPAVWPRASCARPASARRFLE